MYVPQAFAETRLEVLHACIRAHPLGALVSSGAEGLIANHIPFLVDADGSAFGTLRGHVARPNTAWRELAERPEALVIFQGPQAYVSPSWYAAKREHGKVVPTWNYVVVHAHGRVRLVHDADWLHALVTRLTDTQEAGRAEPWQVSDAPADFVARQLRGIVGIELPIDRLVGKWKASQNQAAAEIEAVAAGFEADGNAFAAILRGR